MLAIEVGGSSVQAVLFDAEGSSSVVPLAEHRDQEWVYSAPGFVDGDRVRGAHHIGWMDVSVQQELGMAQPPLLSMNDAAASSLGEWVLQGRPDGLMLYVVMGTGIGGMLVEDGQVTPIEFGHLPGFGPNLCGGCNNYCLDAQIGGHALPTPLSSQDILFVVSLLAEAIGQVGIQPTIMVLAGGMNRAYPQIQAFLSRRVDFPVVGSLTPAGLKSASPFGLLHELRRSRPY